MYLSVTFIFHPESCITVTQSVGYAKTLQLCVEFLGQIKHFQLCKIIYILNCKKKNTTKYAGYCIFLDQRRMQSRLIHLEIGAQYYKARGNMNRTGGGGCCGVGCAAHYQAPLTWPPWPCADNPTNPYPLPSAIPGDLSTH